MPTQTQIKPIAIIGDLKNSNPSVGIARHPLYGFGNIRNVDVQTNPGSIRLNNKTLASASTITGQVTWFARDQNLGIGALYAIDDTNKVYKSTDNGVTWAVLAGNGTGQGQGLTVWKNYLWAVGATSVWVYGPLDSSPAWTQFTAFSISAANQFPFNQAFASIDGNLYIANENHVHKLAENTPPFAPGTAGSYTATPNAITLGNQYNISCMADLGQYLMLGTKMVATADTIYQQGADIFPYDRSTLTLGVPIKVPEDGVQMMISVKSRLYFLAGRMGKLYISDTASYEQIAQIPNYLYDQEGNPFNFYPGAMMFLQGKIYFGVGGGGTATNGNCGVWSYALTTRALQIEHTISTGNDGSVQALYIGALRPIGRKQIIIGWRDVAIGYGIDYQSISTLTKYTGYLGYVESALVKIGEVLGDRTIGNLEVALLKPLASGQGVRIKWRSNLSSAWTTLATFDFATYGAVQGYNFSAATMTNLIYLQVRAELTSNDTTSPELQSVILHPSV